jgi:hypothetical protein
VSVYFITCRESKVVKIGSSVSPHDRLREIQIGCATPLTVEGVMPGGAAEERALHRNFADERIRGEWFYITPAIEALIAANPAPPPVARVRAVRKANPPIKFGETARQYGQRIADEKLAAACEAGSRWLEAQAVAGRIHFPFRTEERKRLIRRLAELEGVE